MKTKKVELLLTNDDELILVYSDDKDEPLTFFSELENSCNCVVGKKLGNDKHEVMIDGKKWIVSAEKRYSKYGACYFMFAR